jgi:hypothetical protein
MGIDILVQSGGWDTTYLTVSDVAFPHGIKNTSDYFAGKGLDVGLHMHPDIVWPCKNSTGIECLATGVGVSPAYLGCPECMLPEGLAPTYRSGYPRYNIDQLAATAAVHALMPATDPYNEYPVTEDLGFWWCHEKEGNIAHNNNPKPCGQGTCNYADWFLPWGEYLCQPLTMNSVTHDDE